MPWLEKNFRAFRYDHVCAKPILWFWVQPGSVWACPLCTSQYEVVRVNKRQKGWTRVL